MDRIGFVIVQYNNDKDTYVCVDSIKKTMNDNDYHIFIVDNHSNNKAYENVLSAYQEDDRVTTIQSQDNLGYAKGANYGVGCLLEQYDVDLVCVLNNDIIFDVNNLNEHLNQIEEPYDLLAPNIVQKDGGSQNPQPEIKYSMIWINIYLFVYYILSFLNRIHLDMIFYVLAVATMGKLYGKGNVAPTERRYIKKLHGSCMFFTRSYLEHFNRQAMHPDTFLFLEEDFLALRCKREQKKILFDYHIKVIHLEDQSMDMICSNTRGKRWFLYQNHIKSFKKFKNFYLEDVQNKVLVKN
ncbi:glycosyltransferase family 2 protein [Mycoplasmatota bacterium]|nr:glycosyltransferase family 2 protein [Mycoplasmatota bacterium]